MALPERPAPYRRIRREEPDRLAHGLGWLSIGLGVAQVLAPRTVARWTGVPVPRMLMVLCGLREIACGIGILSQPRPAAWMNARIAGDALDLAGLATGFAISGVDRRRLAVATAAVAGIAAVDVYSARELAARVKRMPLYIASSAVINRPPGVLYRFWRDLENLPRVMPHLQTVRLLGGNRSHWVAYAPWGAHLEWHSELIDDVPNERLAWRTVDGSDVYNAGSVRFRGTASGSATEVTVELLYVPPTGAIGAAVAKLFGKDAGREMRVDLEAFKTLMESTSAV